MKLQDKVAIITGSAQGIGCAIAKAYSIEGARVVIADTMSQPGEQVVSVIQSQGRQAVFVRADISLPDNIQHLMETTMQRFGRIDILVNNAAVSAYEPFLEISLESWSHILAVNLTGTFLCSQAAARVMAQSGTGRIINLASTNSFVAEKHTAHYVSSKGGVAMLTKAMAVDLAPYGILVNAIAPGPIKTEKTADAFADAAISDHILSRTLLKRPGEVSEVADAAVFLGSDAASYITGHILAVDGGFLAG